MIWHGLIEDNKNNNLCIDLQLVLFFKSVKSLILSLLIWTGGEVIVEKSICWMAYNSIFCILLWEERHEGPFMSRNKNHVCINLASAVLMGRMTVEPSVLTVQQYSQYCHDDSHTGRCASRTGYWAQVKCTPQLLHFLCFYAWIFNFP